MDRGRTWYNISSQTIELMFCADIATHRIISKRRITGHGMILLMWSSAACLLHLRHLLIVSRKHRLPPAEYHHMMACQLP
jgi:hypothetical protein